MKILKSSYDRRRVSALDGLLGGTRLEVKPR